MMLKNRYYYFGKIPSEFDEGDSPEGWEQGYYFRFVLDEEEEQINIEDTCGRMVPFNFKNVWEAIQTLSKIQADIVTAVIGAPDSMTK